MSDLERFPCPCCGYLVFDEPPGSYDICPICFWEDDISQLRFPEMGGASIPLIDAQKNFQRIAACEERLKPHVRPPSANEQRDPGWRLIDAERDNLERPITGVDSGSTYPADPQVLYYWRKSYWRTAARPYDSP